MSKRKVRWALFGLTLALVGVGTVVSRMVFAELPRAPEHVRVPPVFSDERPAFSVCWVEFSRGTVWGELGSAGFTHTDTWRNTASGILVRHPQGDVLIDAGYSSSTAEDAQTLPFVRRTFAKAALDSITWRVPAPEAVQKAGADPARLKWLIPTHAHIDHMGGAVDLPGVPVLLSQAEIDLIASEDEDQRVVPVAHADAVRGRMTPIPFEARPYETFDESFDLFGDGTVVLVPLSGHTPGSVGVFVNLGPTKRLLHIGDTVNLEESIERRLPKSVVMRTMTDVDEEATDAQVAHLSQLHELVPALQILPAHDRDAYEKFFGREPRCISAE
jgi:N-acyl homoserine lactone hydrolase